MRTETRLITYKTFSELSEDEQKKVVEEKLQDSNFLQRFFDSMSDVYLETKKILFEEINEKNELINASCESLYWQSNSQGWYYESNDFICAYGDVKYGIYEMSFNNFSILYEDADKIFSYADFYKNDTYIENIDEIKNKKAVEYFKKVCKKIYEDKKSFTDRLGDIIYMADTYYPEEDEVQEYLENNEEEFETENILVA